MGLLRNIEIWNNQRPRVCNFDLSDYCGEGSLGNTCTTNTTPINDIDWSNSQETARETRAAWLNAINLYVVATNAFFYEPAGCNTESTSCVPEQQNFKCNSAEQFQQLSDLYYGPEGFLEKYKTWQIKSQQWWNCLLTAPDKQEGIQTYSQTMNSSPTTTYTWTYTVDYTNYQTPDQTKYLEYRNAMGDMMQSLKQLMTAGTGQPFTHFDIPGV